MKNHSRRIAAAILLGLGAACAGVACAGDWTPSVEATHNQKRCISYRARLSGGYLTVEAAPEPGWHTFAMDNAARAAEKLAGKQSLSQDMPTEITLIRGLAVDGPWFQSPPKDFSRPELRWFSWGFEERALFVSRVRRSGSGPARVAIRGQVCTETTCKRIDLSLSVPLTPADTSQGDPGVDLGTLVRVR